LLTIGVIITTANAMTRNHFI